MRHRDTNFHQRLIPNAVVEIEAAITIGYLGGPVGGMVRLEDLHRIGSLAPIDEVCRFQYIENAAPGPSCGRKGIITRRELQYEGIRKGPVINCVLICCG